MIRFKSTVRFAALPPALLRILIAVDGADRTFPEDMVITSVNDSTHHLHSAHYRDVAVDLRCNDRHAAVDAALVRYLEGALGPKFLVLLEAVGTPNEHIHIQLRRGETWA